MAKYHVHIREVHINTIEVEAPENATKEDIYLLAEEKHENLDSIDIEYSHTMDKNFWSAETIIP